MVIQENKQLIEHFPCPLQLFHIWFAFKNIPRSTNVIGHNVNIVKKMLATASFPVHVLIECFAVLSTS